MLVLADAAGTTITEAAINRFGTRFLQWRAGVYEWVAHPSPDAAPLCAVMRGWRVLHAMRIDRRCTLGGQDTDWLTQGRTIPLQLQMQTYHVTLVSGRGPPWWRRIVAAPRWRVGLAAFFLVGLLLWLTAATRLTVDAVAIARATAFAFE